MKPALAAGIVFVLAAALVSAAIQVSRPAKEIVPPVALDPLVSCPLEETGSSTCLEEFFVARLDDLEAGAVLDEFAEARRSHPVAEDRCHDIMHAVGLTLGHTRTAAEDIRAARDCHGGLIHGYLTGIGEVAEPAELPRLVLGICDGRTGQAELDCVHGLGHAAAGSALRSAGGRAETASELCDEISPAAETWMCVAGVVMEFTSRAQAQLNGSDGYWSKLDPVSVGEVEELCDKVRDQFGPLCIANLPPLWLVSGTAADDLLQRCLAEGADAVRACLVEVGTILQNASAPDVDPAVVAETLEGCESAGQLRAFCEVGALAVLDWWVRSEAPQPGWDRPCAHASDPAACEDAWGRLDATEFHLRTDANLAAVVPVNRWDSNLDPAKLPIVGMLTPFEG